MAAAEVPAAARRSPGEIIAVRRRLSSVSTSRAAWREVLLVSKTTRSNKEEDQVRDRLVILDEERHPSDLIEKKKRYLSILITENVENDMSNESLRKVASILRKMADTVVEFAEVMAEIGNTRTGGGIIKKTFENIAGMINVVSSSQPAP
nr:uncharacterized protein LOC109162426 [Ipomoea trifida]